MNHVGKKPVYWCQNCSAPYSDPLDLCSVCDLKGSELSHDIRPAFAFERAILEYFNIDAYDKYSVWTTSNSRIYYIDGKPFKLPKNEILQDKSSEIRKYIQSKNEYLEELDTKIFENYLKQVKCSQRAISELTLEASAFTRDTAKRYSRREIIVSFSGGKDSTVVSDLVRKALVTDDIIHIFGDTGIEDENTHEYVKQFKEEFPNLPFFIGKTEQDFFNLVDQLGPPSRVMRWCCTVIKAGPIENVLRLMRQDDGSPIKVLTFYGIRHAESTRRAKYDRITRGAKLGRQITASPIIEWLEFHIWAYIFLNKINFNKSYRLGYSRVGCWICPMNSGWSVFLNTLHFTDDYADWTDKLIEFAKKIGKPDPIEYIRNRKWAARHGGSGLDNAWIELNYQYDGDKNETIKAKIRNKSLNISEALEFFKPLGKFIEHDPNSNRYTLMRKSNPPYKLIFEFDIESNTIEVTPSIQSKSEIEKIQTYLRYQINKYETCIQCTACSVACPHDAITVNPTIDMYSINEDRCTNCNECVIHFGSTGCLVAKSLSIYGKERVIKLKMLNREVSD
jgi:phosphoadenosine phosphosulfate reductase